MILMAIDHVRVFSGVPAGGPTLGVFFTRWITHFCAPAFIFLAGTSIFLYSRRQDRKSTRLNSSHLVISYAVFCLKKKKHIHVLAGRTASTSAAGLRRAIETLGDVHFARSLNVASAPPVSSLHNKLRAAANPHRGV